MQIRYLRDLFLRRFGYARCFEPRILFEQPAARMSCLLELAIARSLLASPDFFFLQIGAFDGRINDPLFQAVRKYHLAGMLVEPQARAFTRLRENYRDQPQLLFVNAAVAPQNGPRTFYTVRGDHLQTASFDKRHLLKHSIPKSDIVEQTIPCFTVQELLRQAGRTTLDLLQIDAEGSDYAILESLDFSQFQPAILRFEQLHMSRQEREAAARRLVAHNYQLHADRMDITALHCPLSHA